MGQNFECTSGYLDPMIVSYVGSRINSAKILVVSKTTCAACTSVKQLLRGLISKTGIIPSVVEVDKYGLQCTKGIMNYISAQTGIRTVPQVYINGRFVGGNDAVQSLHRGGGLVTLILQPMKSRPSITSTDNVNGFGKVYPMGVSSFQRDMKMMPVNESIPTTKSYRKSNLLNYKPNGVSSRSKVRSVFPSGRSWPTISQSLIKNQRIVPKSEIVSSQMDIYDVNLLDTDLAILGKPAQLGSTPSLDSSKAWREVKPVSASSRYISDAQILSEPSFPINNSKNSWMSRERPLQQFATIENEWPSSSATRRSSQSKVIEGPKLIGISDWLHIDKEIV